MTSTAPREPVADVWGLTGGYHDIGGAWHPTSDESRTAILAAMGVGPDAEPPAPAPVRVVPQGQVLTLPGPGTLALEEGTVLEVGKVLPPDLPTGYHDWRPEAGGPSLRVIVYPPRCFLPEGLPTWGWAVQLYAARSVESWGIGDFGDLHRLARWSAREVHAGLLLLNPLAAVAPTIPQQPSPYSPSSRLYLNPLYLRIEDVPGAAEADVDLTALAASGRALNATRRIDRDAVFRLKMAALDRLWARFGGDPAFDRFRAEQGLALRQFATFSVLAERHGANWRAWPAAYREPDAPAIAAFAASSTRRVRFHEWVQWLLDGQLARAAAEIPLMQDLPIGVDPDGADAWAWQAVLGRGASAGAPPDGFNPRGQDWGLPPFVPHRLRAAGYEPLVRTLRAALRHSGGLRIDHIMGLFRLFWVPWGMTPAQGAYVRYPADDLLAIVALESARARAMIVGEDLGTVEDGVREILAARRILSYRLLWFEREPPPSYPPLALAAVTTHDLPTIAGVWSGADLEDQRAAGLPPNPEGLAELRARLEAMTGLPPDAHVDQVILRTHQVLAGASSAIVTATIEDALAVPERPNIPGTSREQRPNWALALPLPLERLETHALPRALAAVLRRRAPA